MILHLLLLLLVGAATSATTNELKADLSETDEGPSSELRKEPEHSNRSGISASIADEQNDVMYNGTRIRDEIYDIEMNILCFIHKTCYFSQPREVFVSMVEESGQPMHFYLSVKSLLERKYGTRFSGLQHPDKKEETKEKEEMRLKMLKMMRQVIQQWIGVVPNSTIDMFEQDMLRRTVNGLTYHNSLKTVKATLPRLQEVLARTNQLQDRPVNISTDYQFISSINSTEEMKQLKESIRSLWAYILGTHTGLFDNKFGKIDSLEDEVAVLISFRRIIDDLYGDLLKEPKTMIDALSRKELVNIWSNMYNIEKDIWGYWWNEVAILRKKEWSKAELDHRNDILNRNTWVHVKFSPLEELDATEKRLIQLKEMTFGSTTTFSTGLTKGDDTSTKSGSSTTPTSGK